MISTTFIIALVALAATAQAHMEMKWPPALSGRYNDFTITQDNNNHAPLSPDGSNFPCRSHLSDLGTPAGASVVTWNAGSEYNFTIVGAIEAPTAPAFHNGGSCQAALSYDKGKTWKVIHSYQGACPTSKGGSFKFNIPADAKAGAAVFSWLWWNHTGNREMYMNCASVTISAGAGLAPTVPFASRPDIFKANIGTGCKTADEVDVFFPNPGPDVTTVGTKKENTFTGDCGSTVAQPASPEPVQSSDATASPTPTKAPGLGSVGDASGVHTVTSVVIIGVLTASAPSAAPTYAPPSDVPTLSALAVSTTGECGGTTTCKGSIYGNCCSKWGWCGSTPDYCKAEQGCMSDFGDCNGKSGRSAAIRGRQWQV